MIQFEFQVQDKLLIPEVRVYRRLNIVFVLLEVSLPNLQQKKYLNSYAVLSALLARAYVAISSKSSAVTQVFYSYIQHLSAFDSIYPVQVIGSSLGVLAAHSAGEGSQPLRQMLYLSLLSVGAATAMTAAGSLLAGDLLVEVKLCTDDGCAQAVSCY